MLLLFMCVLGSALAQDSPQVNTTEGTVEGLRATDGDYLVFYGIPYAGPTEGENRFKAPTPPLPYPGHFHAIDSNVICAQPSERGLIGVENCLNLNIYTKNVTTPKPVFVWLNAEEYTTTSEIQYSYKKFVEQDIVFVKMNFRLSIFGFLCLGVPEAPGNAGLKDVIQGLKWIQSNIASFGGNSSNIVLAGHGSAAAIVDLVTLSPQSQNLVHKAIALSGSALAPWAIAYDPVGYAHQLGAELAYTGKSNQELAQLLVGTDISLLATELQKFKFTNNTPLFAPCLENPELNPNDTFLAEAPIKILQSGNYNHVPYMTGYVTREGTLRAGEAVNHQWLEKMQSNFTSFLQVDLSFGDNTTAVANDIRTFYFDRSLINMATIEDYLDYHGDTMIRVSVIRGARERGATSKSPVWLFEFGVEGSLNSDWLYPQIPLNGVRHGGILNYMFDYDLKQSEATARDALISRLSTFSHNGGVNNNVTSWLPVEASVFYYLLITGKEGPIPGLTATYSESLMTNPHSQRMSFWGELYNKHYLMPSQVSSAGRISGFVFLLMLAPILGQIF